MLTSGSLCVPLDNNATLMLAAPALGSSHLLYSATVSNNASVAQNVDLFLYDGVEDIRLHQEVAMPAVTQTNIIPGYHPGPMVQPPGWSLWFQRGGFGFGYPIAHASYAVDTRTSGGTDYHMRHTWTQTNAGVKLRASLLAACPVGRKRIVKNIWYFNKDTVPHGIYVGVNIHESGVMNYQYSNPAVPAGTGVSLLAPGEVWVVGALTCVSGYTSDAEATRPQVFVVSYQDVPEYDDGPHVSAPQRFHFKSITNAVNKKVTSAAPALVEIENEFTVLTWLVTTSNAGFFAYHFGLGIQGSQTNIINCLATGLFGGENRWYYSLVGAGGAKTYSFKPYTLLVWQLVGITWDGTNLKVYVDGEEAVPTQIHADAAITMADSARTVAVGGHAGAASTYGFKGNIHWSGVWSTALSTAEIKYLYDNPHMNPLIDEGGYASAAELEHFYPVGKRSSPRLGDDFGNGTPIDLATETNLDNDEITSSVPLGEHG